MGEFDPIAFLETAVGTESHESVDAMRTLLVDTLDSTGETVVDDAGNVLAERVGRGDGPHVVLNTHIDTVPPHVPFSRDGDRMYGRGSCDAKGPLAALLDAFLSVAPERGRVTLAVTPDEETDSTGAAALDLLSGDSGESGGTGSRTPDAVIVGEPTGLDVCNAARGRFQGTVELRGENAHAAHPEAGVNAISGLAPVLTALSTFDTGAAHPELGAPTLTPTMVTGGTATNQIPADCSFVIDRRSVPPEGAAEFRESLEAHLQESASDGIDVAVSLAERDTPFLEAFDTPADSRLVRTLRDASGGEVRPFGAATEASYFAQIAPTVVFGPGVLSDEDGAVAHGPREYVDVTDVRSAGDAVAETVRELLA